MSDLWGWLILILVLLLILAIIWWWWKERNAPAASGTEHGYRATPLDVERPAAPAAPLEHVSVPAPEPEKVVPAAAAAVDDLTIVEGIGPKIDLLLKANGIASFAALAAADVQTLRTILRAAGLPYADPATWGEQARLAAAGKMDELQALQDSLKGGRRA